MTKIKVVYHCINCRNNIIRPIKQKEQMLIGTLKCQKCGTQIITMWIEVD